MGKHSGILAALAILAGAAAVLGQTHDHAEYVRESQALWWVLGAIGANVLVILRAVYVMGQSSQRLDDHSQEIKEHAADVAILRRDVGLIRLSVARIEGALARAEGGDGAAGTLPD